MKRLALSIGCDEYTFLSNLFGAVKDARRMHNAFIEPDSGEYDPQVSVLLRSPTLSQLREALRRILFESGKIDTFTFFFAGHGAVKSGSYYLCVADSEARMLSATAFGLADLFAAVNEAQPSQTNVILDACHAGGLVADLHSLLKPELIGGSETPGITIFASSAADQGSREYEAGGVATIELMNCINGTVLVQAMRPTLDLLEVGRAAAALVAEKDPGQRPVVWGLNLYGEARLCKNPHYGGIIPPMPALPRIAQGSPQYEVIKRNAEIVWQEYLSVNNDFEPRRFVERLASVGFGTSAGAADAAAFARGIGKAFSTRAAASTDIFRSAEVAAACAAALLGRTAEGPVDAAIVEVANQALERTAVAISETAELASQDKYAFLSDGSPFGDLFYLPLRLSRILGWIGAQHFVGRWTGRPDLFDEGAVNTIVQRILDTYSLSLVAVSDAQAPYLLTFLSCCYHRGWSDVAEAILGHIANSLIAAKCNLTRSDIDADRIFEFLQRFQNGNFGDAFDLLAQPSETLSVLLLMSHRFGLNDVIDADLQSLDHVCLNVFIPRDHREFSKSTIRNGINHTYEIGRGIWRVAEFASVWDSDCVPQIDSDPSIKMTSVKTGALYAALLFPNRSPWFVASAQGSQSLMI